MVDGQHGVRAKLPVAQRRSTASARPGCANSRGLSRMRRKWPRRRDPRLREGQAVGNKTIYNQGIRDPIDRAWQTKSLTVKTMICPSAVQEARSSTG